MIVPRVFLSAGFVLLTGCGNFFESKVDPSGGRGSLGEKASTFFEIKSRALEPNCVRCHAAYLEYAVVKQNIQSIVSAVETNRMPKDRPPLDDDLKALLRAWLQAGAPQSAEPDLPPVDGPELKPTWNSLYVNIFANRCTVCHSPTGQAPWIDLTNRAAMSKTLLKHINFKDPAASYLIARLTNADEPMPPLPPDSNLPQLTVDEVEVVLEWIRTGLP